MCGCSGNGSSVNVPMARISNVSNSQNTKIMTKQEDCTYTEEIIFNWKTIIECIIKNEKHTILGLSKPQLNQYLGLLQSALNYPDNYCYYDIQLNLFKNVILPRILENVPECINE